MRIPAPFRPRQLQQLAQPAAPEDMGRRSSRARAWRRHGCQLPLHSAQLAVMGILLLSCGVFYGLSVQELPSHLQRTVLVLYSAQLGVTTALFLAISLYDPADPALLAKRRDRGDGLSHGSTLAAAEGSTDVLDTHSATTYATASGGASSSASGGKMPPAAVHRAARCSECDIFLVRGTRHCSICNKCVAGFDHHCVYLNTCIGARNYQLFVGLLSCTTLLLITQLAVTGYSAARMQSQTSDGRTERVVAMIVLSVLPLLELICIVVLASFHMYLSFKHLTTYECMYEWFERHHHEQQQHQLENHKSDRVDGAFSDSHSFLDAAHGRLELGAESTSSTSRCSSRSGSVSVSSGGVSGSNTNSSSSGYSGISGHGGDATGPTTEWMRSKRAHSVVLLNGIPSGELRRDFEERRRASLSEPLGTAYATPSSTTPAASATRAT